MPNRSARKSPTPRAGRKRQARIPSVPTRLPARRRAGPGRPNIEDLLRLMGRLRAENGCPWDREQTLKTLKQYMIEECYEVIDAIDADDPAKHNEELGDLLLQIVFQAHLRQEQGQFRFQDVVRTVCEKLVRRHPHVFGNLRVSGSAQVLRNWEAIKAFERRASQTAGTAPALPSAVDGIPKHLPALHKAHQVQQRASRVGFDWSAVQDVVAKVEEELAEVKEAIGREDARRIREEIGDLLFAVVNLSRFQGLNAETALNRTIAKFVRRFQEMERRLHAEGKDLARCTLREMDAHWEAAKAAE